MSVYLDSNLALCMNTKPNVFVSSTCYDLSQIRRDLFDFIQGFGFQPMLSDHPSSFPIDPDATTVENCIANVRRHADLFVLVVGKRFGSEDVSGKSITNLEYLTADAEGVPVFVFISNEVAAQFPVWKANRDKGIDFPGVDSLKLFEFIEQLRSNSSRWCFNFDSAQQIQQILRDQWASLTVSMLDTRRRTRGRRISRHFAHLSADAQQLILERPEHWEYRLFTQILLDGVANLRFRRRDFNLGLSIRTGEHVSNSRLLSWMQSQFDAALQIPLLVNRLFAGPVMESFGSEGEPGDPEAIVHVAERTVATYEMAIEWAESVRAAIVHERFRTLVDLTAKLVGNMLDEFEQFATELRKQLHDLGSNPPKMGEVREIRVGLVLTIDPKVEEAREREMDALLNALQRGEFSLED